MDFEELTGADKCDSCLQPARAVVLINADTSPLYFCGHHFRKNRLILDARGYSYSVPDFEISLREKEVEPVG